MAEKKGSLRQVSDFIRTLFLFALHKRRRNGMLMSWDERYQQQDTPWDKGAPAPPLLDLLRDQSAYFGQGEILVPGCGRGHDARAIAKAIPQAEVVGLDISATAIQEAKALDFDKTCQFRKADFLAMPAEESSEVSAIFEHTCFCAIDPAERGVYAEACAGLLPSGGHWVTIIFLTPREEDDPTIGPPFQSSVDEIHRLFGERFTLVYSETPKSAFKGRQGKELVMVWRRK